MRKMVLDELGLELCVIAVLLIAAGLSIAATATASMLPEPFREMAINLPKKVVALVLMIGAVAGALFTIKLFMTEKSV